MKLLNTIIIGLSLLQTLNLKTIAQENTEQNTVQNTEHNLPTTDPSMFFMPRVVFAQTEPVLVRSFSTEFFGLGPQFLVDRVSLEIKRINNLHSRSGNVQIYADGVLVENILYRSDTRTVYHNFIIEIGRPFRTLEIYNGLDMAIKVKNVTILPFRTYSQFGRPGFGNGSGLGYIESGVMMLQNNVILLREFVSASEFESYLLPIKIESADAINHIVANGHFSSQAKESLKRLVQKMKNASVLWPRFQNGDYGFSIINQIKSLEYLIERSIQ